MEARIHPRSGPAGPIPLRACRLVREARASRAFRVTRSGNRACSLPTLGRLPSLRSLPAVFSSPLRSAILRNRFDSCSTHTTSCSSRRCAGTLVFDRERHYVTMASLDLGLAWSVEVPVAKLGAHLQAYYQLQPTIRTLRLCNRYGQGPKAAIVSLPPELISEIEGYLIEDERKKHRKHWETDFRCFQGLCKPIDHISDSEQVDYVFETFGRDFFEEDEDGEEDEDAFADEPRHICYECLPEKLTKKQQECLNGILSDIASDDGEEASMWWPEHEGRVARWEGKTGLPNTTDRGLLSAYSHVLLRDFGLQVWITHSQPKGPETQHRFTVVDVYASTIAHISLPGKAITASFRKALSDTRSIDGDMPYLATESGGGIVTSIPTALSEQDSARFSRALRILGLSSSLATPVEDRSSFTTEQLSDTSDSTSAETQEDEDFDPSPKLRILYRQSVDECW